MTASSILEVERTYGGIVVTLGVADEEKSRRHDCAALLYETVI